MTSTNFSKKLVEISNVIAENGGGISYIHNENNNYIIGTPEYSEKIVQYLNKTIKTWKGSEAILANLKKKKVRNKQKKSKKQSTDIFLWTIPITENII